MGTASKLRQANSHTEELDQAKQAALDAYNNFLEAQKHLKSAAFNAGVYAKETASDQIDESVEKLEKASKDLTKQSTQYIKKNPLTSTGVSFVAGYIISRILR